MDPQANSSFAIGVASSPDRSVRVRPEGELDLASSPTLALALRHEITAGHDVLLDLSGVRFIDSTGLAVILSAVRDAESASGSLRIATAVSPEARHLFRLTAVEDVLPWAGSEQSAAV